MEQEQGIEGSGMKLVKQPGFWFIVALLAFCIAVLVAVRSVKAQEPISSAYINAPGQLVVTYLVGDMGVVEETHTIVLSVNEPNFCSVKDDPRYLWMFFNALLVEREPIQDAERPCQDNKFVKQNCKGKK